MKFFTLGCLLFFSINSYAATAPDLSVFAGVYQGQVFNGDDLDPVTTTFAVDQTGRLTGDYVIDDESGILQGTISNALLEGANTLSLEWTDKHGEGFLRLTFSGNFQQFDGYWEDRNTQEMHPWTGARE